MAAAAAVKIVKGPDAASTVERIGCIVLLQQICVILLYPPWTSSCYHSQEAGKSNVIFVYLFVCFIQFI